MAHQPFVGYGVGSFVPAVKAMEKGNSTAIFGNTLSSNPHQEFLLWGVELGVGGVLLLVGMLWFCTRWAQSFSPPANRAVTSIILTITVACLFNSALYDDLIGDFLCFALGISLAYGRQTTPHRSEST
jgi:O-antigen ligase